MRLVLGASTLLIVLLFVPYLHSIAEWNFHRTAILEGRSIALPPRWLTGETGHLLSLKRTGATLLLPYESTIVIDPFAKRWSDDKLTKISGLWLRAHGTPVDGRFRDQHSGANIVFDAGLICVSPSSPLETDSIRVSCLSSDSVRSFAFFGDRDAVADFANVAAQAVHVADTHPEAHGR